MSTNRNIYRRSIAPHNARVMADGGIPTDNVNAAIELMRFYEEQKDSIKLFYFPALTGNKIRTSGLNKFVSKGYSLNSPQQESLVKDLAQSTSTSQPYLSGNIAPNEIYCIENPNNGSNTLLHTPIVFGANNSWSYTRVFKFFGSNSAYASDQISYIKSIDQYFGFYGTVGGSLIPVGTINDLKPYIGKIVCITITATPTLISVYINGVFKASAALSNNCSITFSEVMKSCPLSYYFAKAQSGIMDAQQITQEYSLLRNFIPEMEAVTIGAQTWTTSNCEMAATPMGNVIAEMQAAANVEKITNIADRELSSDTGFWGKDDVSITISGGVVNFVNTPNGKPLFRNTLLTSGKWYKITYTILNRSAGGIIINAGASVSTTKTVDGTYTDYILCGISTYLYINTSGTTSLKIDNISVQEIGWSGSKELYDGIYAQTAGTAEQKTYASVKAAAMWAHYNNDVALGAIYGKLYNWFAIKLLQMDIDYYNTSNPTTPWGWRVPTQEDCQTLSTYLGGNAISGGKLKLSGTTYWNIPNTGADNSSGFSALPSGYRGNTGVFSSLNTLTEIWSVSTNMGYYIPYNSTSFTAQTYDKIGGFSLRLIKT